MWELWPLSVARATLGSAGGRDGAVDRQAAHQPAGSSEDRKQARVVRTRCARGNLRATPPGQEASPSGARRAMPGGSAQLGAALSSGPLSMKRS